MHTDIDTGYGWTLAREVADGYQWYVERWPSREKRQHIAAEETAWIASVIEHDCAGIYYPFTLTCSGRMPSGGSWFGLFRNACSNASCGAFPELSRWQHWRHTPDKLVGVIVVPSLLASGSVRWHGFIRIPVLAMHGASDAVLIGIHDQAKETLITGPEALRITAAAVLGQFQPRRGGYKSLWIAHESVSECRRPEAADHRRYPQVIARSLASIQNTSDRERRDWMSAAFLPGRIYRRVAASISPPMDPSQSANRAALDAAAQSEPQMNGSLG